MEVLGVLILAQVGEDATRAVFGQNLCGDPPDDGEQFEQKPFVVVAEGEQRRDVAFGDDDDVRRVEGARVVEGEHVVRLGDLPDGRAPASHLVAIKVSI